MQHRRKLLLEVDAFAEAVCRNQEPKRCLAHLINFLLPEFVRQFTGYDLNIKLGIFFSEAGTSNLPTYLAVAM